MTKESPLKKKADQILKKMTLKEKSDIIAGADAWHTMPVPRLGLPSIKVTDGPNGVRTILNMKIHKNEPAVTFPTGTSMGATWDRSMVYKTGQALGEETLGMGCNVLLAPTVNIIRHPLAGRNFECFSEDPYLTGELGSAYVEGIQSKGAGTSLKHFACNSQETERRFGSSEVDERTLREIYLAQFETIIKRSNPWTVMCSYNKINGLHASENKILLNDILRKEWGYEGAVVSDWGAVHTSREALIAGLDLEMPGPPKLYGPMIANAVRMHILDEKYLDRSARRVIELVLKAVQAGKKGASYKANTQAHIKTAQALAEASITLLKNDSDLLPLKNIKTLAVIGPNAAEARLGGGGSAYVQPVYKVTPLQGLKKELKGKTKIIYKKGCSNNIALPHIDRKYLRTPDGKSSGLLAEFFMDPDMKGQPVNTEKRDGARMWAASWNYYDNVSNDRFGVRFRGKLIAPDTDNYTLELFSTTRSRLLLNGKLLLSTTRHNKDVTRKRCKIDLKKGKTYSLQIEFSKLSDYRQHDFMNIGMSLTSELDKSGIAEAVQAAERSDAAVIFAGFPEMYESEGSDRPDMELPGHQNELIRKVLKVNPKTIVVLNSASPVSLPWADKVPAIMQAYYPGMEGGTALARVLTGKAEPKGRLTVTYPHRLEDTPAYENFPGKGKVHYGEGIFVGYRYYDHKNLGVLFPFGHGLSYTEFKYTDLKLPARVSSKQTIPVSVTIQNTGKRTGTEIVQIYVSDLESSLARPPQELKGFEKISLKPGEKKTAQFILTQKDLSFYDPEKKGWVAEPGTFEIRAGRSSRDIRVTKRFTLFS